MWYLMHFLSKLFDWILIPFDSWHPFWPILVISFPTGVMLLIIFRYTSNQTGIRDAKDRIKAHLLEIRLFKDNLKVLLNAQKNIFLYNAKYLRHAVVPMLVMIIPVSIVIIQLHDWFGYRPLKIGESFAFKVEFSDATQMINSNISIKVDKGLSIETPALRIYQKKEVSWRIRVDQFGEQYITIKVGNNVFHKKILVSINRLARVSPVMAKSHLLENILYSGEKPIDRNSVVDRIEAHYPNRSIHILGRSVHWLVLFFILSITSGFILKGLFKVEL